MKSFVLKPPNFRKLNYSSEMRNDALAHREGLKGQVKLVINPFSAELSLYVRI